jgi:hypothetical protein
MCRFSAILALLNLFRLWNILTVFKKLPFPVSYLGHASNKPMPLRLPHRVCNLRIDLESART